MIPDESKSLRGGAIKPWQTKSYAECQEDLEKFAKKRGIPLDTPWRELRRRAPHWVIEGEGDWSKGVWYGAKRFFAWLETESYKMHVRVLLSRYRAYTPCADLRRRAPEDRGTAVAARQPRAGRCGAADDSALPAAAESQWSEETLRGLPGLSIHDVMLLPVERACEFFQQAAAAAAAR